MVQEYLPTKVEIRPKSEKIPEHKNRENVTQCSFIHFRNESAKLFIWILRSIRNVFKKNNS